MIPAASTRIGRWLRLPLRLVPKDRALRVLTGPLAGMRWISTSAPHGCWLGTYERDLQDLMARMVRPGDVVFDIGANAGFFTLLASRLVGERGRVVALEPLPRNREVLERHLALNRISNVTVIEAAASDSEGVARFQSASSPSMGRLGSHGEIEVRTTTLDALVVGGAAPAPQLIKMDIEGSESRALAGAADVIAQHRPVILLSTHGHAQHQACWAWLAKLGYDVRLRRDGTPDGQYEIVAVSNS